MSMKLHVFSRSGGALSKYKSSVTSDFSLFLDWIDKDKWTAHDLETTYTDSLLTREMLTAAYYRDDTAWVIFIEELTSSELTKLKDYMSVGRFIIQGVKFEYKEWRKLGVKLTRFYCTLLTQKLLSMGKDTPNDLAYIVKAYTGIELDKGLQTSFVSCKDVTDEQLKYAVLDVIYLHTIKKEQEELIRHHDKKLQKMFTVSKNRGLKKANWWNHQFILVIADLEYKGVMIDTKKWEKLHDEAKPMVTTAKRILNSIVAEDLSTEAIGASYINGKDTFIDKLFTSSSNKLKLLTLFYKDIEKVSEVELKKYLSIHDSEWEEGLKPTSKKVKDYLATKTIDYKYYLIKLILDKDEFATKFYLYKYHKKLLQDNGILIPKGTVGINWASSKQRKEIFQWIVPELEQTDKEHIEEVAYKHRLFKAYLEKYQKYVGMVTKFGLNYLKTMDSDGRLRTNINPIINTGRISSSKPNILNIVNDARYRACFIAPKGYKYVMTDFQGEELVLTAYFSKEKLWIDTIKANKDLHSINASVIFKKEWQEGTEDGCEFLKTQQKCNCKAHKKLRQHTKTIEFGSLYGMSKFGMAFKLQVTVEEAEKMLKSFFKELPNITKFLNRMANMATTKLYNPELVLGACRFVEKRKLFYDKNSVKRTSGNFAIQGAGASILKIATVLIRRHVIQMGHDVTAVITPYDEIILECEESVAEYWKVKLQYYMELAGKLGLRDDILKTDVPVIEDYWVH